MKIKRPSTASGLNRHYSFGPGARLQFVASAIVLSMAGASILFVLGAFRQPPEAEASTEARSSEVASRSENGLPILVVFTDHKHLGPLAAAASEIRGVTQAAEVAGGVRWLSSWNDHSQEPVFAAPGYRVPIDVGAVDPVRYREMVPQPVREKFPDLASGGAILSRSAAALRGIKDTGMLRFEGTDVPVIGVVDDELTRYHEALVGHQAAAAIGLDSKHYLVVALESIDKGKEVAADLRRLLPPGSTVKIRGPRGSGVGDPGGLLSVGEIKTLFGEFQAQIGEGTNIHIPQSWIDENTRLENVALLGTFRCHKALFPQLRGAIAEIQRQGLAQLIHGSDFGGCFSPRFIRAGQESGISRHAWGIAIDFNVSSNLMGETPTIDPRIVKIMEKWGFSWGGNWTIPDGMHFEFVEKL